MNSSIKSFGSDVLALLILADIAIMTKLFSGKPYETMSAAAWSLEQDGKWFGRIFRPLIDALFYVLQRDHCATCWLHENPQRSESK